MFATANWKLQTQDEAELKKLCKKLRLGRLSCQILMNRGITDVTSAENYLYGGLELLHDPFLMSGMAEAADRVASAVGAGEKILIFGDYDVDGISATSLLIDFLSAVSADVSYHIPSRMGEGYGLNMAAVEKAAKDNIKVIITVDCGITSIKEAAMGRQLGIDVIITDHHMVGDVVPDAYAVVNASREDCGYPFKSLAGVGLAFKLACGIRSRLVECGTVLRKDAPNLKRSLDLVALGTVADMVPLVGENRLLVRHGLREMRSSKKIGLKALMNLGNIQDRDVKETDIGFYMAPRLNAMGRLGSASAGVELLTTDDKQQARKIALKMEQENSKRQLMQAKIVAEAVQMVKQSVDLERDKIILLASPDWHPGIIGIVASKVVELFNMPTVLLNIKDGICRGSARSVPCFHLLDGLSQCKELFIAFGGHKYAAGLTIKEENLNLFREKLLKIAEKMIDSTDNKPIIKVDGEATLDYFTADNVKEILDLGPFGVGNANPKFICRGVSLASPPFYMGKDFSHVKLEFSYGDCFVEGLAFGMGDRFRQLGECENMLLDIVFSPMLSNRGAIPEPQLKIVDFKVSG